MAIYTALSQQYLSVIIDDQISDSVELEESLYAIGHCLKHTLCLGNQRLLTRGETFLKALSQHIGQHQTQTH